MGILYVVATPIGNLEDITLRALRVLREVRVIAAEDTRRTAKLLQHYSIATPTTSLHEHNEREKTERLLERLAAGDDIALVSDAGTPLVSDPGVHLVRSAREAGQPVVAIPGASAVMAILSAAGADATEFSFLGFPPRRSSDLNDWIAENLTSPARTVVFFEAPHRVRHTLTAMGLILGDRPITVARELTKIHEELVKDPIQRHLGRLNAPKGEFVILLDPADNPQRVSPSPPAADDLADEVGLLAKTAGLPPRRAARLVAEKYGLPVNAVYRARTGKASPGS